MCRDPSKPTPSGSGAESVSVGMGVSVGTSVSVGDGISVSVGDGVNVGSGVSVGVFVGVLDGVDVGVKVGVLDGVDVGVFVGVKVLVGGTKVLVKKKKVEVGLTVVVGVAEEVAPVRGMDMSVSASEGPEVGPETTSEKATTVSAITVLILETRNSTTPTDGVPIGAEALISLTPTAAAPHSRPKPRMAATRIQMRGR